MADSSSIITDSKFFHVYKTGELVVIGFESHHLANPTETAQCRDSLLNLIDNPECRVLVVDFTGVQIVTSWILGVLASVQQAGVKVCLYHPSEDIRDLLDVSKLDELLELRGISVLDHS